MLQAKLKHRQMKEKDIKGFTKPSFLSTKTNLGVKKIPVPETLASSKPKKVHDKFFNGNYGERQHDQPSQEYGDGPTDASGLRHHSQYIFGAVSYRIVR